MTSTWRSRLEKIRVTGPRGKAYWVVQPSLQGSLFDARCGSTFQTVKQTLAVELQCYSPLVHRSYLVYRYLDQGFQALGSRHVQGSGRHSGRGGRGYQRPQQATRRLSFWQAQEVGSYPNLHIACPGEPSYANAARCCSKTAIAVYSQTAVRGLTEMAPS